MVRYMSELPISHLLPVSLLTAAKMAQTNAAIQEESEQDLNSLFEYADNTGPLNPMTRMRQFDSLEKLKSSASQKGEKTDKVEEEKILGLEEIGELADQFHKNNDELNAKTLLILKARITPDDSPDDVINKVLSVYPDPALADEALDFLIQAGDPQLKATLKEAKEKLNATYSREIKAGRNMGIQAREFAKEGLGSPTSLRDLYRDVTGTPRDALKLFDELAEKYRFEKMKSVITFLLHSLGNDLKSKGPSIPRGELKKLIDDTRSLQGILGVFRFFQSRMQLILRQFTAHHLVLPERLDYELLARSFIRLIQERYMNPEKIRQSAALLGISEELLAQIIIYNQMRDAIRQIAPRYYRNQQHKEELNKSFIDLLEKLEDELEEEDEEEKKD
jgi:type III secretion protein W